MSRIRILPDHVANQIAAGEVVERPSSILKELVENALDAGARRLEIRWEEGGRRLLEVADDGSGMARDDLYLALERHATSKVRTADDLGHLATYGFRGEALPSIASVTRTDLASAEEEGHGHVLRCEFGVIKELRPAARSRGTTVTVRDLFAQLPARRRFLKSVETEHAHLWGVVSRLALATPEVHWTLRTDRGGDLHLPPVEEAGARLAPLLGERLGRLVPFREGAAPWTLRGYLSPPDLSFRDRNHLYLFVNGRAVRDRLLLAALASGWEGVFPKGAYPAAVIFLDLPPEAVDVNVHPTKAEVRFREPQRVFPWLSRATREAWTAMEGLGSLLDRAPAPEETELEGPEPARARPLQQLWGQGGGASLSGGPGPSSSSSGSPFPHQPSARPLLDTLGQAFPGREAGESPLDQPYPPPGAAPLAAEAREGDTAPGQALPFRYLGAFQATYLLAEVCQGPEPELWVVDQHVAHERILFEKLFDRRHSPAVQPLMPPQVVHLGPAALARIQPFLEEMARAGVEAEPFSSDALVVRGLPDFLCERDPQALLEDLLERLERTGKADLDAFRVELNAELACRAAVKKHERLPPAQAEALIRDLLACRVPHTCPHGRPVIKKLGLAELERSFGRRV